MTRRDHAVVGGLVLVLAVLAAAIGGPDLARPAARPSPTPAVDEPALLREGVVGAATSVNPLGARTQAERDLVALVFSGLVRLGPSGTFVPDLATSWVVTPDGKSWTFQIRSDARWHDGTPVTPADVVFTIETLQDPGYTGPGADSWRAVTATVAGTRAVRFDLAMPLGGFLQAATQPIAPAHLLRDVPVPALATDPFGRHPVGSGPFALVELDDAHALLQPAADPSRTEPRASGSPTTVARGPVPYLPGIDMRFYARPSDLAEAYRAGDVDAASGLAPGDAAGLAGEPNTRLIRYPGSTVTTVSLNLRAGRTTFRDPDVRKALLAAIDRDGIAASVYAGYAARADGLIAPASWAFDVTAARPVVHDPTAAAAVLQRAGWSRTTAGWVPAGATTPLRFELLSTDEASSPLGYRTAEAVVTAWKQLGLDARHVALPPAELVGDRLRTGDYDAALIDVNLGLDPDLYPLLASTQARTGGSNIGGLQDPELDALLVAARGPGTDEARRAAYAALQVRLAERQYLLPIVFREVVVVARDTLQGPASRQVADPGERYWDVLTWRLADDR